MSEKKTMTMAAAINAGFHEAMAADPKIVVLGEDIEDPIGGPFKTSKGLSTAFGRDRVRSTPIAEGTFAGTAVGLALGGYRPVAEIMFFDFITLALDQVINHAAKLRYMTGGATPTPILVTTVIGSSHFGAQHAQSLEAWFMHTPGINVVMPSNPVDAKGLLQSCLESPDPCLFIQHSGLLYSTKEPVEEGRYTVPLGKAATLRTGTDITLVTYGTGVSICTDAAKALSESGVEAEVIDLRSLVPLDLPTVMESVERTRRCVIVHEATEFCGPGAEISSRIHENLFNELLAPVGRVGAMYTPVPFSKALNGFPTVDRVVAKVRELI
ncbi:alpha-ketoacid dehydrogenase subunit beta [Gordonia sp. GONU]|uniref:alpha-ketoacid dehydrogenase subunit beta n=1 Tax=Gordonia TaxID=2053 RepID=UPI0004047543|nr:MULTISPECIES: alpha-ketoacid dehydrogenase subunit beta [Gordonia]MCR8899750.1 alpha-ketoacid dehydrogenase subunit beta [Gordonia sp. GONU]MCZ4653856.1 alpha-ketoacid dehydrogenase subunit beta [Gordonia amicalis]